MDHGINKSSHALVIAIPKAKQRRAETGAGQAERLQTGEEQSIDLAVPKIRRS